MPHPDEQEPTPVVTISELVEQTIQLEIREYRARQEERECHQLAEFLIMTGHVS